MKNELQIIGMLSDGVWQTRYKEVCRVFSPQGIAPTLTSGRGGGIDPKILVRVSKEISDYINSNGDENETA